MLPTHLDHGREKHLAGCFSANSLFFPASYSACAWKGSKAPLHLLLLGETQGQPCSIHLPPGSLLYCFPGNPFLKGSGDQEVPKAMSAQSLAVENRIGAWSPAAAVPVEELSCLLCPLLHGARSSHVCDGGQQWALLRPSRGPLLVALRGPWAWSGWAICPSHTFLYSLQYSSLFSKRSCSSLQQNT